MDPQPTNKTGHVCRRIHPAHRQPSQHIRSNEVFGEIKKDKQMRVYPPLEVQKNWQAIHKQKKAMEQTKPNCVT